MEMTKATITLEGTQDKIDLLIAAAHEMGITIISTCQYKTTPDHIRDASQKSWPEARDSKDEWGYKDDVLRDYMNDK